MLKSALVVVFASVGTRRAKLAEVDRWSEEVAMPRSSFKRVLLVAVVVATGIAEALKLVPRSADSYDVYCGTDDKVFVGTMYWNGSRWSDGLRWHEIKEELAKLMAAAHGSDCV